jgi:hypothetical protein
MLWLSKMLTSLEKQQVLDQAAELGDNYHLDKCGPTGNIRPATRALFHSALACSCGDFLLCHSSSIVPETPTPLLG